MIPKLLTITRIPLINNFCRAVLRDFEKYFNANDAYLSQLVAELDSYYTLSNKAFLRRREKSEKQEFSKAITESYRSLYYFVLGNSHHPVKEIKQSAASLLKIMNQKDSLSDLSKTGYQLYASLDRLFTYIESEGVYQNHISQIPHCEVLVQATLKSLRNYQTKHYEFGEIKHNYSKLATTKELKVKILKLVNGKLIPYMAVMMESKPDTYLTLGKLLTIIVNDTNAQTKDRVNYLARKKGKA